ncbi:MAG: hypothetical protein GY757_44270 [bacterium]|nr:hypothetical protein [bacterium]
MGIRKGYNPESEFHWETPDETGSLSISLHELERLELRFPQGLEGGRMVVGTKLMPLPVGSHLNKEKGIFCWQPGVGFSGNYQLIFKSGIILKTINIQIENKSEIKAN